METLVPGVDRQHIDLALEDGVLTVTGERKEAQGVSTDGTSLKRWSRAATVARSRYRSMSISTRRPPTCQNGTLTVTLPKREEASRDGLRSPEPSEGAGPSTLPTPFDPLSVSPSRERWSKRRSMSCAQA